jgi:hypothetical protein
LRNEARGDDGLAAKCLLAALGTNPESEAAEAHAYVGALILIDAARELRTIRRMLTPPSE